MPDKQHPFGYEITAETVTQTMASFKGWEDRYRQVIQWGKQLPQLDAEFKHNEFTVSGCESSVWLLTELVDGCWHIKADSDARIVRGLIAIVLAAYEGKTSQQILEFDIDGYFDTLQLINHLSPTRGNGLKAIVETVQSQAKNAK
ncbi:cysteine desulfurase sulfur acceptor subunit CsdE [Vibrio hippocampi]|uniref:Sulfur acceptor protein CsdE n=1 Tax=Vibrio hippocampi TaxID=654686 RepID=A0ABM8ZIU0_9VIBR|nr:cysteine desulfurase sulfur acceptor subunit CsdE [Vibrio hippocampi]CAH0526734.1 Sulfur acceptor protein CsdE [Vibrio hippocampi]